MNLSSYFPCSCLNEDEALPIQLTLLHACRMKCPLGSTNKRFLLNTLRLCAAKHQAGSRSATQRGAEDSWEVGDRGSRHCPEDRGHGYRKDTKYRRERERSHSQSSRPCDSSVSELATTDHAPHHTNQANRTRSRSPIRERLATKRSTDRTQK